MVDDVLKYGAGNLITFYYYVYSELLDIAKLLFRTL